MNVLTGEYGVRPTGVLHLGANICEEAEAYREAEAHPVIWFEANPHVIPQLEARLESFPAHRLIQAAVSDLDHQLMQFHISSNWQSSSLLKMKRHLDYYPQITEIETVSVLTATVDTLLRRNGLDAKQFNFANLDLQGTELCALRGMKTCLPYLRWIYAEVNFEELYAGCVLIDELDDFLRQNQFARVATVRTSCGWGDALYQREADA